MIIDHSSPMTIRVRFAPSPTGYLHVGGARTALFNWLFARARAPRLRSADEVFLSPGPNYLTAMLPALSVAVGNATALRVNPRLPAETVTLKGTPASGRVPSPMSTVAVPLKVALPSAATDPLLTSPSTVMFCGVPRSELPRSTAWNWPVAEPAGAMNIP